MSCQRCHHKENERLMFVQRTRICFFHKELGIFLLEHLRPSHDLITRSQSQRECYFHIPPALLVCESSENEAFTLKSLQLKQSAQ